MDDKNQQIQPVKIQDLNKTQLILLAILLSFVVSIATGIVTATLLQQAPPAVTQTINRVVQHTIEKVVPDYIPSKTQTIVVKEDDLVVDAVSKIRTNLFPVFDTADSKVSLGNVYSVGDGIFISQSEIIDSSKSYVVKSGDLQIPVKVSSLSPDGIAILSADPSLKGISDLPKNTFGKDEDIRAGETAIVISPTGIFKDMIQNIIPKEEKDSSGNVLKKWNVISLGQTPRSSFGGSPVSDLDGNIIGFVVSNTGADGTMLTQVVGVDLVNKMLVEKTSDSKVSATSTTN